MRLFISHPWRTDIQDAWEESVSQERLMIQDEKRWWRNAAAGRGSGVQVGRWALQRKKKCFPELAMKETLSV